MRKSKINWTTKEVEELFTTEVKKSPNNLLIAFTRISRKLKTNTNNVSKAWYRIYRNRVELFNINGEDASMKNIKNTHVAKEVAPIHESIVSTQKFDGMIVVTIKKYYVE
jgi:hypothetical protein